MRILIRDNDVIKVWAATRRDGLLRLLYIRTLFYAHTHARTYARTHTREPRLARETNFVSRAHVLRSRSSLWCERTTVKLFPGEIYIVRVRSGRKRRRCSIHDPLYSRLLDKANVKLAIQNSSQGLYNIFMNCLINFNSVYWANFNQILLFNNTFRIHIFFCNKISQRNFRGTIYFQLFIYITWNSKSIKKFTQNYSISTRLFIHAHQK